MASFFDLPLEIIMQIIAALQDDLTALEAISQACHSFRPLCRPFIFRSIEFTPRHSWPHRSISNLVKSFGRLLDKNPEISAYCQTLVYEILPQDLDHDDIPRILMRFHRVRSFRLLGGNVNWNTPPQPWRESLSHIIHLPTIESLEISYCKALPIALFSPCLNLTSLTVIYINDAMVEAEEESSVLNHDIAPQLRSFTFGVRAGQYAQKLFAARRLNGLPLLNFKNLRALTVHVNRQESDLPIVHAILKAAEKLETLQYIVVDDWTDGFEGFAASINPSSLSTLKRLRLEYDLNDDVQDPLFGISAELEALSGINRFEEIHLSVLVQTDNSCNAGDQWAALDVVLATGFPMLRRVSLHITIAVYARRQMAIELQEKLQKLPEKQLLRLSTSSVVRFDFSTKIELV